MPYEFESDWTTAEIRNAAGYALCDVECKAIICETDEQCDVIGFVIEACKGGIWSEIECRSPIDHPMFDAVVAVLGANDDLISEAAEQAEIAAIENEGEYRFNLARDEAAR